MSQILQAYQWRWVSKNLGYHPPGCNANLGDSQAFRCDWNAGMQRETLVLPKIVLQILSGKGVSFHLLWSYGERAVDTSH